jgi:hypothetical protein
MRNDNNERDRSIDRLLRRRLEPDAGLPATGLPAPGLPAPGLPATDACVDAETLAAWMDGSLSREALDRAEHHAAGCARCQAMLASMARTAPDTAGHPWWRSLTARWVVPIAAAATAVALWVSVDRQQNPALPAAPPPAQLSRTSEPAASPAMLADARARSAAPVAQDKAAPARSAKADASADTRAAQKSVPEPVAGGAAGGRVIDARRPSLQTRSDNAASVGSTAAATAAPGPPPPPAAPALANAAPVPAAEPSVISPLAETVRVIPESSAKRMRAEGGARGGTAFTSAVEIVSPEPAFRWRLSAPDTIQRSTDGGATWQPQAAPAGIVLTAGSSPARDVCWIVGRAGTVVLSTDGTAWKARPFPEAVNLAAVRAIDAKNATVTTSDGRQFSTADGGATWSKLPL